MAVAKSLVNGPVRRMLGVRPVYTVSIKEYTEKSSEEFFKFYSEDNREAFSDKYRPLTDVDYTRFISRRSAKKEPALTRTITSLAYKVGKQMISLAEGMPNEEVFPFSRLQLDSKEGSRLVMEGGELAAALQYVPSQGLPALLDCLRSLQQTLHRPPPLARDVLVTSGSQHGIYLCFELLVEPGDPVITTEFAYTGALAALRPYEAEVLGIPEDSDGMDADVLESVLAARLAQGLKMPKVLYTIPVGNNPTGVVMSEERKRRIYDMACRYDLIIVEDDPYMYLNYDEKSSPSFLSLDSCGRVLRLDSMSKVVSAGLRAAWVTGPPLLLHRMELHMQAEILHSCTLSQAILLRVLEQRSELAAHLQRARAFYGRRRDALVSALARAQLPALAEYGVPQAGLFLWLSAPQLTDVYDMVFTTAFSRGLMLIPGQAFMYDSRAPSRNLRLTFSKVPLDQMDTAAVQLAELLREEQTRQLPRRLATER